MTGSVQLSACIVAMNEADRIGECLDSVDFCDEVIVVDSHSSDDTREVARARGAKVFERDWPGFGPQKQFAIEQASHDWILILDADERVSPALRAEILSLVQGDPSAHAGYDFPRLSSYFGAWVPYGTWYPDRVLRLFDRRRGRMGGQDPHAHVELDGTRGHLRADLFHHPYRSFDEHLATIDRYTTTMAEGLVRRGHRAGLYDLVVRPFARFVKFYFFKRGCLHGWRGLLLSFLAAHYVRMKYAKVLVRQRGSADA